MSITLTIRLLSGEDIPYVMRKGKYFPHRERIRQLVLDRVGVAPGESYYVRIFESLEKEEELFREVYLEAAPFMVLTGVLEEKYETEENERLMKEFLTNERDPFYYIIRDNADRKISYKKNTLLYALVQPYHPKKSKNEH